MQRSWSAQIMKRQPSGEMALPPAWPAWQVGWGGAMCSQALSGALQTPGECMHCRQATRHKARVIGDGG